ncbi:MAG: ADP-ribosylglycohydrolase family protein [Bacilli bacterium]|nr:ADP-ribosylglycohydrolase family protein [Bacilli bacterium]
MNQTLNKALGCLIGGAIGDALGYPIEFCTESHIQSCYGFVDHFLGKPEISDDTQMAIYTAISFPYARVQGFDPSDVGLLARFYLRWFEGQMEIKDGSSPAFLRDVEHFNDNRAPGNTCLSALSLYRESGVYATIKKPYNTSKGCGGVMRAAPIGVGFATLDGYGLNDAIKLGAESSALTHGNELGWMPGAYLAGLVYLLMTEEGDLLALAKRALEATKDVYGAFRRFDAFESIVSQAISLSKQEVKDIDAIHALGEGWVGEEALAISLYCALKHSCDFRLAIAVAVNHKGDSDSTGAITGNILGAYLGLEEVKRNFPEAEQVEFYDLIEEVGRDMVEPDPLGDEKYADPENKGQAFHRYKE